jgi:hypothetical protein
MQRSVFISNIIFVVAFLSFGAQFFIDFSVLNISAACIVLTSSLITLLYFRCSDAYFHYPLSSFAIFGLLVTTQFGALVAQFILWTSLTKDLRVPIETFSYLFMFQMTAILAHVFYRMLANTKNTKPSIVRYTLDKLGLYQTPSILVVWVMGLIGLAGALLARGGGSDSSKVATGIQFIMWFPFIIPIYRARFGEAYCNAKLNYVLLGLYTLLVLAIGIIFNARGFMLNGIVTLISVLFLETLRSKGNFTSSELFKIFLLLVAGAIASVPLSDLSTAMVVARADRGKVSDFKVAQNAIDVLTIKRELIKEYREHGKIDSAHSSYDESYVQNPLLARFAMTKFADNMFYFGGKLNETQVEDLTQFSFNSFSTIVPAPLLKIKWLGVDVDKTQYEFSTGDYMVMLATGIPVGGYKTGSAFGQGFAIFGYFYAIIYFFICIVLFYLKDLYSYKTSTGAVIIAPIGLFGLYSLFLVAINTESIKLFVLDIVRNTPQSIILYLSIFHFARLVDWVWRSLSKSETIKKKSTVKIKLKQSHHAWFKG